MSKLEEIKAHQLKYKFSETKDILWLIEQAEKVERYEEALKDITKELDRYCSEGWTTKAIEIAKKSLEV